MKQATAASLLLFTAVAISQDFHSSTRLVLLPVTVTGPHGTLVNGLNRQAFRLVEEGHTQPILSFAEEILPCSLAIVFDISASMGPRLSPATRTLRVLFDQAEPGDEALLITVADRPVLRSPLTLDLGGILAEMALVRPGGNTALNDSIALAFERIQAARNAKKALIVISDGVDNQSRLTRATLLKQAMEADVEVHTIVLARAGLSKPTLAEVREEQSGDAFLDDLSRATGGLSFTIRDEAAMHQAAASIAKALRTQYLIGFRPTAGRDGKHHSLQVRVAVPGTQVHSRRAYLAN